MIVSNLSNPYRLARVRFTWLTAAGAGLALLSLAAPPAAADTPCGGLGQPACEYSRAVYKGKAKKLGCPKGSSFSARKGGECWSCKGWKRTLSPVTSKKACVKKRFKGPWKRATFVRKVTGCRRGEYFTPAEGGKCYVCPTGYRRGLNVNGIRSDKACKANKETVCKAGLKKKRGVCREPGGIFGAAKRIKLQEDVFFDTARAFVKDLEHKGRVLASLKQNLEDRNWNAAQKDLKKIKSFAKLKRVARKRLGKIGAPASTMTLTIGFGGDASLGVGASGELGIAIDLHAKKVVRGYRTGGLSIGLSAGGDGGIVIGMWPMSNHEIAGRAQGITSGLVGGGGGGAGVWFDYDKKGRYGFGNLVGVTMNSSLGLSAEAAEYNRVRTKLF